MGTRIGPSFDDEARPSPSNAALGGGKTTFVLIEPSGVEDIGDLGVPKPAPALWRRVQTCVRSMFNNSAAPLWAKASGHRLWPTPFLGRRPRLYRLLVSLVIAYLSVVGAVHVLDNLFGAFEAAVPAFPDHLDRFVYSGIRPGELSASSSESLSHWPTDATGDIHPVNCHSHNDYWRAVPLYDAIYAGCTGVEADVWLVDDRLLVGHRRLALTSSRTLQDLYLNPLLDLLEQQNPQMQIEHHAQPRARARDMDSMEMDEDGDEDDPIPGTGMLNGVFDVDPTQTLVVLIDFKTSGPRLWAKLNDELGPLRERGYLTHFNGSTVVRRPVTVVGSGNAPFDLLIQNDTYRDVFFDAPLEALADTSSLWPNPNREQDPTRASAHRAGSGSHVSSDSSPKHAGPEPRTPTSTEQKQQGQQQEQEQHQSRNRNQNGNGIGNGNQTLDQGGSATAVSESTPVYDPTNSYYASVSFTRSIGRIWGSRLTQSQLQLIRSQIRGAHQRGLKVR
ncbi:hypothetical protein A1O3_10117 [Capronia epimyces CBS 606.96]|uniref:Altered inheritance of mitochondria protein 6 n=1 Tax=Capronia epimyces CBS 606.96 TaxID=1182542 RepID=W9XHZ2_9EURO|nr:uncharacterized protein A1O3_10117 [Capronia epimyces CBS 606.96]EXJ76960.1 hypothetical protein A1O3_10117 [Capronia epimyces CBS 606.96]